MKNQWDDWMRLTLTGDKKAYKQLLIALQPWLMAFFTKRVPSAVVEDLVQETMITLHEKRHTYNPSQPFMPWLITIAKHRWIDYLRKIYRHQEVALDKEIEVPILDSDITISSDIIKLLQKIPAKQAEVIDLVKLKEMTIEQASQKTGYSSSLIKVMIHRGLKHLNKIVKEEKNDNI
ncbi:MAG: sigma-70 family RNA polymerase sigma factor [Alphaproteobacteria bacterium]|nr:sigma-70 family RNA polymerase sigma factor [Alphaproteobacteria bacterium]